MGRQISRGQLHETGRDSTWACNDTQGSAATEFGRRKHQSWAVLSCTMARQPRRSAMSDGSMARQHSDPVKPSAFTATLTALREGAESAARLDVALRELARVLDMIAEIGIPEAAAAAQRVLFLDVARVLALPPAQATLLMRTLLAELRVLQACTGRLRDARVHSAPPAQPASSTPRPE